MKTFETLTDFFNASEKERKKVLLEVVKEANEEQRKMMNKCKCGKELPKNRVKWCRDRCESHYNYKKRVLQKSKESVKI